VEENQLITEESEFRLFVYTIVFAAVILPVGAVTGAGSLIYLLTKIA
jgi:hypothetical protein